MVNRLRRLSLREWADVAIHPALRLERRARMVYKPAISSSPAAARTRCSWVRRDAK